MSMGSRLSVPLFDRLVWGGGEEAPARDGGLHLHPVDPDRFTESALRSTVRREIGWILNTTQMGAVVDLDGLEEVEKSVLNYGVPDLAGKAMSFQVIRARARSIRQSLRMFEPRLDETTLGVEPVEEVERDNALTFLIEADIRSAVNPVAFRLKTDVESDGGGVAVRE